MLQSRLFALALGALVALATAIPTVDLRTSGDYAILAKTGVSTVPASAIYGDLGLSPISVTAFTGFSYIEKPLLGFAKSTQVTGRMYAADFASPTPTKLTTAVGDMQTAYTDAASRPTSGLGNRLNLMAGMIGGATLSPGVYNWGTTININADIYIKGGPTDIFILQTTGKVLVAAGVKVILQGGVKHQNIFWQVAGNVKVGAGAHLEGCFLVKTDAAFVTGSSLNGRVLAQTAVTLQTTTIDTRAAPLVRRLRGSE